LLSLATMQRPDNGGTMPGKRTTFTPSSILFRPRRSPAALRLQVFLLLAPQGWGGGAGYRPRVRKAYYEVRLSP
jgi:hypothetical protein